MKGFTLVETLVYTGLLAIILGGTLTSIQAIQISEGRNATLAHDYEERLFVMEKIRYELHHTVTVTEPITNATSSRLVLNDTDGNEIRFSGQTGNVTLSRRNSEPIPLSDLTIHLSELLFYHGGMRASSTDPEYMDITLVTVSELMRQRIYLPTL